LECDGGGKRHGNIIENVALGKKIVQFFFLEVQWDGDIDLVEGGILDLFIGFSVKIVFPRHHENFEAGKCHEIIRFHGLLVIAPHIHQFHNVDIGVDGGAILAVLGMVLEFYFDFREFHEDRGDKVVRGGGDVAVIDVKILAHRKITDLIPMEGQQHRLLGIGCDLNVVGLLDNIHHYWE
jgi:hypothetical protein